MMEIETFFFCSVSSSSSPFDLAKLLEKLISLQKKKLDDERYGLGQAKSNVVLIIPYQSSVPDTDKEYCIEQIKKMREQVPGESLILMKITS